MVIYTCIIHSFKLNGQQTIQQFVESTFELQVIWDAMTLILRHGNAWAFIKPSLQALKVALNDGVRGHETDRMETYHSNL